MSFTRSHWRCSRGYAKNNSDVKVLLASRRYFSGDSSHLFRPVEDERDVFPGARAQHQKTLSIGGDVESRVVALHLEEHGWIRYLELIGCFRHQLFRVPIRRQDRICREEFYFVSPDGGAPRAEDLNERPMSKIKRKTSARTHGTFLDPHCGVRDHRRTRAARAAAERVADHDRRPGDRE